MRVPGYNERSMIACHLTNVWDNATEWLSYTIVAVMNEIIILKDDLLRNNMQRYDISVKIVIPRYHKSDGSHCVRSMFCTLSLGQWVWSVRPFARLCWKWWLGLCNVLTKLVLVFRTSKMHISTSTSLAIHLAICCKVLDGSVHSFLLSQTTDQSLLPTDTNDLSRSNGIRDWWYIIDCKLIARHSFRIWLHKS